MNGPIAYVAPVLPTRSETFVYNEILRLRKLGVTVQPVSLRPPTSLFSDDPKLAALAQEAICVYGDGVAALLRDAFAEFFAHPLRTSATSARSKFDAVFGRDVPLSQRPKLLWQAAAGIALARRLRPLGIRHVHAHFAHAPTTIAMIAARQLGVGFSFTGHANDLFQRRSLLPAKLARARFAACISHWHRDYYRQFAPNLSAERLPIVRCGVDLPAAEARSPNDPPLILGVGRLVPKKGFDVLIAALGRLVSDGVPFQCRLIGDGPDRDRLEALCDAHGLNDWIAFCGAQPHGEILAALKTADLFVLPCKPDDAGDRDGIPVALMEAMAAGVAVVAGDLPAIRELVRDGDTGVLSPPGDESALAACIEKLLADDAARGARASAGRAWVQREFSADDNTHRLLAAFERALSGNRGTTTTTATVSNPMVEET